MKTVQKILNLIGRPHCNGVRQVPTNHQSAEAGVEVDDLQVRGVVLQQVVALLLRRGVLEKCSRKGAGRRPSNADICISRLSRVLPLRFDPDILVICLHGLKASILW